MMIQCLYQFHFVPSHWSVKITSTNDPFHSVTKNFREILIEVIYVSNSPTRAIHPPTALVCLGWIDGHTISVEAQCATLEIALGHPLAIAVVGEPTLLASG